MPEVQATRYFCGFPVFRDGQREQSSLELLRETAQFSHTPRGERGRAKAWAVRGVAEYGMTDTMTRLLEKAIARARELPDEDQDAVAVAMLTMTEQGSPIGPLDDETQAAIREGLEQARRGEFVPDEKIEALWKCHGL